MLTARSEHRLSLRADNAGLRLTHRGLEWGCIGPLRAARHASFAGQVALALDRASQDLATPYALAAAGIPIRQDGRRRTVLEVLALPDVSAAQAAAAYPWLADLPPQVAVQVEAEAFYAPHLRRQDSERRMLAREDALAIPARLDFRAIPGLSAEMQHRLSRAQPDSLGSASRVPGVTPAAVAALAIHLRRGAVEAV